MVAVDWSEGAKATSISDGIYITAALNTKFVGKETANMLSKFQINLSNVHCIGHSLGAHCIKKFNALFDYF